MKQDNISIKPYLRQFYRDNWGAFALSILETILMVVANLMISWLMQVIVDLATGAQVEQSMDQMVLQALICMPIFITGMWLSYISTPRFISKAMGQYKEFVFQKISQKGISAFAQENTSFYISALSNDANAIESDYLVNIFALLSQGLRFVGAMALMLWYSPLLTFIGIGLSLLPVAASLMAGNRVAEAEKTVSHENEAYISSLSDSLSGFSVIKSFQAEEAICRLMSERIQAVSQAKIRRRKTSIVVQSIGQTAGIVAQFGVFIAGAMLALNDHPISAGVLIAFLNLMNYVVEPIASIPPYLAQRKAARALIAKTAKALETNVRQEGAVDKRELEQAITLEHLSFGYEKDKPVLHDLDFTFEAGKSYCLVGSSGSGKSTLLNLLMAAHHGYTGSIRYDDTELGSISSEALYGMVSVVQQNVFVFNASIRDNVTMFSRFPDEAVEAALELSGLSALIRDRGAEYLCGENGSGLSGGEKQRLSIARSLLKKAQVLLVDEATAALDVQTASQVSNAILNLDGITRVVVTHALDQQVLKRYDCILTLKNGAIAESGTFEELMTQKGYFYSLFTLAQ